MNIDQFEEIDRETAGVHEIDMLIENGLQTEDDDEAGNETSVTGEMTPEIGIEDATRTLLTYLPGIEVMKLEIEHQIGVAVPKAMMFVLLNFSRKSSELIAPIRHPSHQPPPGKLTRRKRQRGWPN
jgi:hypothetical protein